MKIEFESFRKENRKLKVEIENLTKELNSLDSAKKRFDDNTVVFNIEIKILTHVLNSLCTRELTNEGRQFLIKLIKNRSGNYSK